MENHVNYSVFDLDGEEITNQDLQDKEEWCEIGVQYENEFIDEYGYMLGLIINPEKKVNKYAPDLLNIIDVKKPIIADLKYQSTPFFQAGSKYQVDPNFAVVFNIKDRIRYHENYPDIQIYFWVRWEKLSFKTSYSSITCKPVNGVWAIDHFDEFEQYLDTRPIHFYQQRVNDEKGNAKGSYVCDSRDPIFIRVNW